MADNPQPQFGMQRVYLKDVSFESPNSPKVFTQEWKPEIKLDLNTGARQLDEQHYEVSIKITLTASQNEEAVFLVELEQAALFALINIPEDQVRPMLGTVCPNMLFPYLRENIDSLVVKGGFPALVLSPINFDALYQQRLAQEAQAQAQAEGETTH